MFLKQTLRLCRTKNEGFFKMVIATKQDWLQRQEDINTIVACEFDYVFTFNTRQSLTFRQIRYRVREFEKRLNRQLFGKQWHQTGKQLGWIHNYEHSSGNTHSHSVVKLSDGVCATAMKRQARRIWKAVNKGKSQAQLWIDTINDKTRLDKNGFEIDNRTAVAVYVLKGGYTDYTPL